MSCQIYGIKNCDTMKKAFAWLDSHGVEYEFVDYKKAGVLAEQLPRWNARVGWETLLNKRGLTWRKLSEAEREDVDEASALALMQANATLVKRPVLVVGGEVTVGFDPEAYAALF